MGIRVTECRCSEDRRTLRTVYANVKPGVDVELASWRGGRVEVYVLEDGIYMFANYLDQFESFARGKLDLAWQTGLRLLGTVRPVPNACRSIRCSIEIGGVL